MPSVRFGVKFQSQRNVSKSNYKSEFLKALLSHKDIISCPENNTNRRVISTRLSCKDKTPIEYDSFNVC